MGRKNSLYLLLLVISPVLVSAEKGKSAWWSTFLISIVYIGFIVFAAALAIFIRRSRERRDQLDNDNVERAAGLDVEEIDSLPSLRFAQIKMYRNEKGEQQELECVVCLSEFKDQEVLRILPDCLHVFHPHCIAPWLASHVTCPVCRLDFILFWVI
uniref:RING-type E3 ubiquitin transferase n=1 Tax=Chenopodium quinoa TaxID=63459 RepID=A0A803LUU2_CHEQI